MTTDATRQRPRDPRERMKSFIDDCPGAGAEFPDFTAQLLGGGEVRLSSLAGRAVVLEVGSFT
jgi:hypothetical protein